MPELFSISSEVLRARSHSQPVVALETTVVTHGLPYPDNLKLAREMEDTVRAHGATPATIGVLDGTICVGMDTSQVERLATLARDGQAIKISLRDFAKASLKHLSGGTTVAGTLFAAHKAGLRVFATGGIGGVHRGAAYDVSTDLFQLSRTPVMVVCAGAKAILDLPTTLEVLETLGVPVVGYQTGEFPAFYSASSGLKVPFQADTEEEAAQFARRHWELGLESGVLLAAPPPREAALPESEVRGAIDQALQEAEKQHIRGQAVTPFLLQRVSELTVGHSLQANLALLLNNARIAARVAGFLVERKFGKV